MHTIKDKGAHHFKELILAPDYSSTGLWCSCGLGLADPEGTLGIPERLTKLAQLWNDFWDVASTHKRGEINPFLPEIISIGEYIAKEISEYIPCTLNKETCAL